MTTTVECLSEVAFCLGQADRSDNVETRALCLGVAALWQELALLLAREEAQGTA